jgi:hypothetical protein
MRKREAGLLKESMTKKEREPYTAYHEAGHVAIAHVLGIEYGSVTIMGCTTIRSPRVTLDAWDARGRSRFNGRDLRSSIAPTSWKRWLGAKPLNCVVALSPTTVANGCRQVLSPAIFAAVFIGSDRQWPDGKMIAATVRFMRRRTLL